jgi:hypothetical protein
MTIKYKQKNSWEKQQEWTSNNMEAIIIMDKYVSSWNGNNNGIMA